MKHIIALLLLIGVSAANGQTLMETLHMENVKHKRIRSVHVFAYKPNGTIKSEEIEEIPTTTFSDEFLLEYDMNGRLSRKTLYNTNSLDVNGVISEYSYDKNGNITEEITKKESNYLKKINVYNENNDIIETTVYSHSGSKYSSVINKYNERKILISTIYLDGDSNVLSQENFTYDATDKLLKEEDRQKGKVIKTFDYKYDSKGILESITVKFDYDSVPSYGRTVREYNKYGYPVKIMRYDHTGYLYRTTHIKSISPSERKEIRSENIVSESLVDKELLIGYKYSYKDKNVTKETITADEPIYFNWPHPDGYQIPVYVCGEYVKTANMCNSGSNITYKYNEKDLIKEVELIYFHLIGGVTPSHYNQTFYRVEYTYW